MTGPQIIPWKRPTVEAAAIVASILLAFAIDAWWEERESRSSAHLALVQMLAEMREDSADLHEIREDQLARSRQYLELDQWLASPELMPLETVAETL